MLGLLDIPEALAASRWPILGERSDRLELPIQVAFRKLVREHCRGVRVVAIPNAGKRGQKAVRQAKAEGMQSGFPDTMCLWGDVSAPEAAFIEFKRGDATASSVSYNQAEWLDWLRLAGFSCCVCRDERRALEWLRSVGAPFAGMSA